MAQEDADPTEQGNKSIHEIDLEAQAVVNFVPIMLLSTGFPEELEKFLALGCPLP
jgi:hypothetical protein